MTTAVAMLLCGEQAVDGTPRGGGQMMQRIVVATEEEDDNGWDLLQPPAASKSNSDGPGNATVYSNQQQR